MKTYALATLSYIALLASLLAANILLNACTPPTQLPEGARLALNRQWDSFPGSTTHDLTIVRAWQGKLPRDAEPASPQPMEIWCVETRLLSKQPASGETETIIWFITKVNDDAPWETAPLMTMSSIWPYQACGVMP